jgi:hypothetical protein
MSDKLLNDISKAMHEGARVSVGRNYYGGIKLKLYRGPFGLFSKTVTLSGAEFQLLMSAVKLRGIAAQN